jgi:uncharacterized protein
MPTNILRKHNDKITDTIATPARVRTLAAQPRRARLTAGRKSLVLELHDTMTAELLWRAMPIFSVAETWGAAIHFDTPVRAGRDRTARLNARSGDLCFWAEDNRVMIVWGATPISKSDEIRLMRPSNIWAHTLADASILASVTPGEKIKLERIG